LEVIVLTRNVIFVTASMFIAASPVLAADGAQVFQDLKCNTCHAVPAASIESKLSKMPGGTLPKEGETHDAAWFTSFLKKEIKLDGKEHKKTFKGSDEELKAVADWLVGLQGK